jgi:hypothetical protein
MVAQNEPNKIVDTTEEAIATAAPSPNKPPSDVTVAPPSDEPNPAKPKVVTEVVADLMGTTAIPAEPIVATAETDPRVDQALGIFSNLTALEVTPAEVIAAKEILTTMPVRKPKKNEFVRVAPETPPFTTYLYQDDEEGTYYFIEPEMRPHFIAGTVVKVLVPAVNQLGAAFIWPVPVEDGQGSRNNSWNESHRAAYQMAKTKWTKMVSDRASRVYRVYEASGNLADPQFCPQPFNQQLALAFRGISTISDREHPVLRAMRGDIP